MTGKQTPLLIDSNTEAIQSLVFKAYRNNARRLAEQFLPDDGAPQARTVVCPWGDELVAKPGDYIVSEIDTPSDHWPVDKEIFEQTYIEIEPKVFSKKELTYLAPLTDLTGDPDRMVTVETMEGPLTVRAGDFYLARGIKGEIWPYPRDKAEEILVPVDEAES